MADELIDIYDSEMNLLGTAMKSQADEEGLWHKAFHGWIIDGDKVWLQQRGKKKRLYPGLLDITATAHLLAGETAKQAGSREIEEVLGLEVEEKEFEKLFTYKLVENDGRDRVFCPTYALKSHWKLADVMLLPDEVDGIFEAKIEDLIELFEDEKSEVSLYGFCRGDKKAVERTVSKADFAPRGANYYLKVLAILERMTNL